MSLVSYEFWTFILIVFILYHLFPKNNRWVILLLSSYYFFLCFGKKAIIYLLLTTLSTYHGAHYIQMQKDKRKKRIILLSIITLNLLLMVVLRQGIFLTRSILGMLPQPWSGVSLYFIVSIIGISYYTLKVVGYMIDVYHEKVNAADHLGKYALYVSFFPEISQGPIEKFQNIYKQYSEPENLTWERFRNAAYRILWGTVKKVVIAEKIGSVIWPIFSDSNSYSGYQILLAAMLYSMQLYADFSGYMDIMRGVAELFGIKIAQNFNVPYISESIENFWHRWHMTMGAWFREYIFYPLSTSRLLKIFGKKSRKILGNKQGKKIPIYFVILVTWFATGLWHGGEGNWIIWGILNGVLIIGGIQFKEFNDRMYKYLCINKSNLAVKFLRISKTFILVSILRIFSHSDSLTSAIEIFRGMIFRFSERPISHLWNAQYFGLAIVGCICLIIGDIVETNSRFREKLNVMPCMFRWALAYLGIIGIIVFQSSVSDFLYAQF